MHEFLERLSGRAYLKPLLVAMVFLFFLMANDRAKALPCPATTITAITPSTWVAGQTYDITVTGSGFGGMDPDVTSGVFLGCGFEGVFGVAVLTTGEYDVSFYDQIYENWDDWSSGGEIISDSQITAKIKISASSPTQTACVITGITYGGADGSDQGWIDTWPGTASSCIAANGFPVQIVNNCPTPTITSITPSTWFAGKTYNNVRIRGTNFITTAAATTSCPVTSVSIVAADGSTVAVSNVTVISKTRITATVAPDASFPTQAATVKAGSATTSGQILGTPKIEWNTDSPEAVVGQPIKFSTDVPSSVTISKNTWTVGGTNVGGYTVVKPTDDTPTVSSATVTKTVLNSRDLLTYWLYPKSSVPVTYQYCVNIPGVTVKDLKCSLKTEEKFVVIGPTAKITSYLNPPDAYGEWWVSDPYPACLDKTSKEYQFLAFGKLQPHSKGCDRIVDTPGIEFEATDVSNVPNSGGNFVWVQLLTKNILSATMSGVKVGPTSFATGLDSSFPYTDLGSTLADDSPTVGLSNSYSTESRRFSAKMYLLWKSDVDPDSIYVPIGYVTWSISGTAKNGDTSPSWSLAARQGLTTATYLASEDDGKLYHGLPHWTIAVPSAASTSNQLESVATDEEVENQ